MGDVLYRALGASNHANISRADNDFYATPPAAVEMLLEMERFAPIVWEPACGAGHISKVLEKHGYIVESTDIKYRGFGQREPLEFLTTYRQHFEGDIITNPPYSTAEAFARRAIDTVRTGGKVAMLLKIQFLEGKSREDFFRHFPPKTVYISRSRICCARDGDFGSAKSGTLCFAWYIWEKGFTGEPTIRWFN